MPILLPLGNGNITAITQRRNNGNYLTTILPPLVRKILLSLLDNAEIIFASGKYRHYSHWLWLETLLFPLLAPISFLTLVTADVIAIC